MNFNGLLDFKVFPHSQIDALRNYYNRDKFLSNHI